MLTHFSLTPTFGFGDRRRLATTGPITAVSRTKFPPIFAQQSVPENTCTRRTPQQVIRRCRGMGFALGADDFRSFVEVSYTFFTVDPGEHVDG